MAEHKKKTNSLYLRASAWRTWQTCALSLILKDETPFAPESDAFAAEGTALHAAIESELTGKARATLDVEHEAIVRFAVDATKIETSKNKIKCEQFIDYPAAPAVKISGTADVVIDEGDTICIIDHKTGWKAVEAENNAQLKIYAHLFAGREHKKWRGVIINARLNSISYTGPHDIEKNYLRAIATDAKKRASAKQTKTGNHCAYCAALAICKPVREDIKKWLSPGADDGIKDRKADWQELLSLAKPAEKLFERAKADALKYIDLGGEIPGVGVEYSGGSRAWPRDLDTESLAARLGVAVETITETKTISPAQAEKVGVSRDAIRAIAIQPTRRGLKIK